MISPKVEILGGRAHPGDWLKDEALRTVLSWPMHTWFSQLARCIPALKRP